MRADRKARRFVACLFAGLLLLVVALPSMASGAEQGARWHISFLSFPTVLEPGVSAEGSPAIDSVPQYSVVLQNTGGAGTTDPLTDPLTITLTLPSGIIPDPSVSAEWTAEIGQAETCSVVSPNTVVCEVGRTIEPGGYVAVTVPIDVGPLGSVPATAVSHVVVSGGGPATLPASKSLASMVGGELPSFGFLPVSTGLAGEATAESGLDADLAGAHPYFVIMEGNFPTKEFVPSVGPIQNLKNLAFTLPQGFVANPQAPTALCTDAELNSRAEGVEGVAGCPPESQVGDISIMTTSGGIQRLGLALYAMQPAPGVAAEFGFSVLGTLVHVQGGLDGSFHLTARGSDILARYRVLGITAELWGNPGDPRHDALRRGKGGCGAGGCALTPEQANKSPFLTMPTSCGSPLNFAASATSWEGGAASSGSSFLSADGSPLVIHGCNALAFEPSIESKATTNVADSPSGLEFSIHQPQNQTVGGRATASLKDARVTLPEGMTVNASGANGLAACSEEQIGYAPVGGKIQFETTPQSCPNASKVGTLEVSTPLLGHKLPGSIYVAKPFANPFGSLVALYLAVEDEESGIIAKLAGKVEPDPATGRLTATFRENPDLPVEEIQLHVFNGANATLKTPLTCGINTTLATLTPWSTPEGADAYPTDSFQVQRAPSPGACPSREDQAPNSPTFTAGTVTPLSGAYSPFVLRLARADGSQHITRIDMTLPEGLLGKLAGIPYCPEAGIALAKRREAPEKGKEELSSPSCPEASEIGTVQVTAGAGPAPLPVSGRVYLAGPYKGAPLSLVVIVPAVAGPFDLGDVAPRVALNIGEYDARIHAVSDPLPTILDGVPVDVRSIELKLNRTGFTLNPTSCEAKAIEGSVTTQTGQTAPLKNRFQVGECNRLGFKPALQISLKGPTKRAGHPALKAVVTYPKKGEYANIARAQVSLPHSEFLDQNNLNLVCKQADLSAGTCPAKAVYGKVKMWTPLLAKPLEGNVYLGVGFGYKLPALVAELNGQVRVLLKGKVDTDKQKGIRNTFEAVPDAPFERFVLELKGGKKYGLLVNSENLCKKQQKAEVMFGAQNGKTLSLSPVIANSCKTKHSHHKSKKRTH
jgi:hypothetical protein